jgi:hypothetical protein
MKNNHTGKMALIVGNGPSANIEHLERSSSCISFGMNQVFKIFKDTSWRPTYYALSDTLVAENFGEQILDAYNGTVFASDHLKEILGDHKRIVYFQKSHEDYIDTFPPFSRNCLSVVYGGYTTAYLCMQLSWYFGIRNIATMGIDANYNFASNPCVDRLGIYEIVVPKSDNNWFINDYFTGHEKMIKPKTKQQVLAYHAAKFFIERHGGSIHNIGKDSPLDVFARVDFDSLF